MINRSSQSGLRGVLTKVVSLLAMMALLSSCGKNQNEQLILSSQQDNIIGGQEISSINDPVAKSTVLVYDTVAKGICTGSLLGNNIVLTAAHCIGRQPQNMLIIFTQNSKTATKDLARAVTGAVTNKLWAISNKAGKDHGDIALIKYSGATPAGYTAATLLPNPAYLKNGSMILLAGFGISNGTTKQGAGVLRQVMTLISNAQFSQTEIQVEQRSGRGACHGDSGGPAFIVAGGNYFLWGVTSRGYQDREDKCNQFGVYTNAFVYYKWIQDTSRALMLNNNLFQTTPTERTFGRGTFY